MGGRGDLEIAIVLLLWEIVLLISIIKKLAIVLLLREIVLLLLSIIIKKNVFSLVEKALVSLIVCT